MPSIIPTDSTIAYTEQRVTLGGIAYRLALRFNARTQGFHLDVALDDGTMLAAGLKCVPNMPLLYRFTDTRLPPGVLAVVPNSANDADPGLGELGENGRCTLWYFEPGEL